MPPSTSQKLLAHTDEIMSRWEARANDEVLSALRLESLALRDSLPELLALIAHVLSTAHSRSEARKKWEKDESIRVGRKHGRERADTHQYTISQMIFEYHILRQVICDVMEEEGETLSPTDREVIVCAIEQAVNDASSQYSLTIKEAQERLAATITHDLKGPLTVASLATQRLLRRADDAAICVKSGKRILGSIARLELMIQNLLDVSRMSSGKNLSIQVELTDIGDLVHTLAEDLDLVYEGRVTTQSSATGFAFWDEAEINRLVENLTSNAAKHGKAGTAITVELSMRDDNIILSVHNEGSPIAAEDHASLFRQFHRGDAALGHKGWGIGLTVVKGIVEAHRVMIFIESSRAAGTTFVVELPRDARVEDRLAPSHS